MTDAFIVFFGALALVFAGAVLLLRQPMRAALALVAHMICLAAIYACLGVHVIALFQVLIYVGAVMVFMVYTIMLLDDRDIAYRKRFSATLVPGVLIATIVALALLRLLGPVTPGRCRWTARPLPSASPRSRPPSCSSTGSTSSWPRCCCSSASSRPGP